MGEGGERGNGEGREGMGGGGREWRGREGMGGQDQGREKGEQKINPNTQRLLAEFSHTSHTVTHTDVYKHNRQEHMLGLRSYIVPLPCQVHRKGSFVKRMVLYLLDQLMMDTVCGVIEGDTGRRLRR